MALVWRNLQSLMARRPQLSWRIAWGAVVVFTVMFLINQAQHRIGKTTSDSPSYLNLAIGHAERGTFNFEAWREYGYQGSILLLSWVLPWSSLSGLIYGVTALQVAAYLTLFVVLVFVVARAGGAWAAALVALAFAMDRFNGGWMSHIMSEAPSKLLTLAGLIALIVGGQGGRWWRLVPIGALLIGLVPLFRSADLAVPIAAILGVLVWIVLSLDRRRLLAGIGLALLLAGPTYLFCTVQEIRTGFFGLSARGADHVAARFIILANPDKVLATGVAPDLVEEIFRPIYTWWNPLAWRRGNVAPGSPDHFFPLTRDRNLMAAGAPSMEGVVRNYLERRGEVVTPYTVAQMSAKLAPMALRADPVPILGSIGLITWDYLRLPFLWNYWGEARFQIYLWPVLWFVLAAYVWRFRRRNPAAWGFVAAGFVLLPGYWTSIAMGSAYNPRFATHQHMTVTIALLAACLVPDATAPLRRGQKAAATP